MVAEDATIETVIQYARSSTADKELHQQRGEL